MRSWAFTTRLVAVVVTLLSIAAAASAQVTIPVYKAPALSPWASSSIFTRKDGLLAVETYKVGAWAKPFGLGFLSSDFSLYGGSSVNEQNAQAFGILMTKTLPTIGKFGLLLGLQAGFVGKSAHVGLVAGFSWQG